MKSSKTKNNFYELFFNVRTWGKRRKKKEITFQVIQIYMSKQMKSSLSRLL